MGCLSSRPSRYKYADDNPPADTTQQAGGDKVKAYKTVPKSRTTGTNVHTLADLDKPKPAPYKNPYSNANNRSSAAAAKKNVHTISDLDNNGTSTYNAMEGTYGYQAQQYWDSGNDNSNSNSGNAGNDASGGQFTSPNVGDGDFKVPSLDTAGGGVDMGSSSNYDSGGGNTSTYDSGGGGGADTSTSNW